MKQYTVGILLTETMNVMGEAQKYRKDYAPYVVDLINRVISDLFHINNAIRKKAQLPALISHPIMETVDDVIPYEYETINDIMTYGLAFFLYMQDDEFDKAIPMNQTYEDKKAKYMIADYERIESVFGWQE